MAAAVVGLCHAESREGARVVVGCWEVVDDEAAAVGEDWLTAVDLIADRASDI